jgi:hypothetical protein
MTKETVPDRHEAKVTIEEALNDEGCIPAKTLDKNSPHILESLNDSPDSTLPSTPINEQQGNNKNSSIDVNEGTSLYKQTLLDDPVPNQPSLWAYNNP